MRKLLRVHATGIGRRPKDPSHVSVKDFGFTVDELDEVIQSETMTVKSVDDTTVEYMVDYQHWPSVIPT